MTLEEVFHPAHDFKAQVFIQSSTGWFTAPPWTPEEEGQILRDVILFVSTCQECCFAADSPAYLIGMN